MRALLLVCAMLGFVVGVSAQSIQPCSDFSIEAVEKTDPGTPIVLSTRTRTNTSNVSLRGLRLNWSLSVGTIMAGQGTSSITVDTTGLGGQVITATVEVVGNQIHCSTSKAVEINPPRPPECWLDSYGDIKWEDEKARLDNFAIQMLNIPSARGALFTFAGNPTYKGEAAFRLNRAANYLVNVRNIPRERLLLTDAGYSTELMTYLWIVPEGAIPPAFDSELALSEVRFTKPKPKVNRKSPPRRRSN